MIASPEDPPAVHPLPRLLAVALAPAPLTHTPSVRAILAMLIDAGEEGELASLLARRFSAPELILYRCTQTNNHLNALRKRGLTRRGSKEPSPVYNNCPVYRWYITPDGEMYYRRTYDEMSPLHHSAVARAERVRRFHIQDVKRQALAELPALAATLPPRCPTRLRELVLGMRRRYLTLQEIGDAVGLTRERIRQYEAGINLSGHKCQYCDPRLAVLPDPEEW